MTDIFEPGRFASFNARAMTPRMVAQSFIAPQEFQTLARRAHTVVVGPRGSGKTTMLKMLTPEALAAFNPGPRVPASVTVEFSGIFVPTDISWSRQLDSYRSSALAPSDGEALVLASFSTAVFRAFCTALESRSSIDRGTTGRVFALPPLRLDAAREVRLARGLAEMWDLKIAVPSLLGVRTALSKRLVEIGVLAHRERRLPREGRLERMDGVAGLGISLLTGMQAALDVTEQHLPETQGDRWALLFDELELAPDEIRAELVSALRSVDERLLFKLSLSPYSDGMDALTGVLASMPGHDHDVISLGYGPRADIETFTAQLMEAIASSRGRDIVNPRVALGSDAASVVSEGMSAVRKGGRAPYERHFRALAKSDQTFRAFLGRNSVDIETLLDTSGSRRAQLVRKIAPIVVARAEQRSPDGSAPSRNRRYKTRRNAPIYQGFEAIAAALEGNPRWIIALSNALFDDSQSGLIAAHTQTREIDRTANRFRALLSTIPVTGELSKQRRGLLPLVDSIGVYFRERVIADEFTPDPVGSFTVDSDTRPDLLAALGSALNTGAIVHVPGDGDAAVLTSLRGARFRLSYLLATQFGLPLRLERPVALSRIMPVGMLRQRDGDQLVLDLEGLAP